MAVVIVEMHPSGPSFWSFLIHRQRQRVGTCNIYTNVYVVARVFDRLVRGLSCNPLYRQMVSRVSSVDSKVGEQNLFRKRIDSRYFVSV
jgi:hypothetical protein